MVLMATTPKKDRHKQPKMTIRPSAKVGNALREIAGKEDRTITAIVTRALKLYAEQNGHSWPS